MRGGVYLLGMTEGAMGVADRRFTRRQYLLYQALMERDRTIGEANAEVQRYATEHPDADLSEQFTWREWMAAEAERV